MGLTRDDRGVATYTVDDAPTRNALGTAALITRAAAGEQAADEQAAECASQSQVAG